MSVTAQRALRTAINDRKFDLVYYLYGDDDFRRDEALAELLQAAIDPATRDFNYEQLRGNEATPEQLSTALDSLPMLAERRVVVLRDVTSLRKAARAVLDRYLGAPAPSTLLVLTTPGGTKADAEIARRATKVDFPLLDAAQMPAWLVQQARRTGVELPAPAAALLADAVGTDTAQAAGELEKLASFANGAPVDAAAIEAVVGVRRGETVADLLDAVASRDAARAIALVSPVLSQPKTAAVTIVGYLGVQVLAMASVRAARETGLPASRVRSEFMDFLKSGGGYPGRSWGDATESWVRTLDRWPLADLDDALEQLLAADLALKSSTISSDEGVVSSLVLALCVPRPVRSVA